MLAIIGCGNANRNDDQVGVYVALALKRLADEQQLPDVKVFDAGTAGMEVIFHARGCQSLIIIDANQSGSEPGSIFEVPGDMLTNAPPSHFNLHSFRWDHAIYAGQKIFKDDFPKDVTVYLIEAKDLGFGFEMTNEVAQSAEIVIKKIMQRLSQR